MASPVWRKRTAIAYWVAAVAGALLTATGLLLAGGLLRGIHNDDRVVTTLLFVTVAIWAVLGHAYPNLFWLPQNRRQVTQRVVRMNPLWAATQFGFEMGSAVRTYITAASVYVLGAWLLFFGSSILDALLVAVSFASGRSAVNWLSLAERSVDRGSAARAASLVDKLTLAGFILMVAVGSD